MEGNPKVKESIVDSRINKVLSMRTDSVAMLESLDAISEFYSTNTVDARRMLRQDIELQNINLAKKFLLEFDILRHRIDNVEQLSDKLQDSCHLLALRVKDSDSNMKLFINKASLLENKRNFYEIQSKEIQSFLSRFQLPNDEIQLLYYTDLNITNNANLFFSILNKLQLAYLDCKIMVEKHCYTVGFELLEVLSQHQDIAYQHLFEWVKSKCDVLSTDLNMNSNNNNNTITTTINNTAAMMMMNDDLETNTRLQIAIRFLKNVPIYFDQCQDLLINSRRSLLVQRFVIALTQGDNITSITTMSNLSSSSSSSSSHSTSSGRALDLHAHDAVRYVSGMLAWMHQAIASEVEFLEAIFGSENKYDYNNNTTTTSSNNNNTTGATNAVENVMNSQNASSTATSSSATSSSNLMIGLSINELLARCLQGLGRPLRVRIIQTLETKTALDILYSLTDLLAFYQETFFKIVPIENAVHSAVKGCLIESKRLFLTTLNRQGEYLTQSPVVYPIDLKASHVTRECAIQIKEMLRVVSNSLSSITLEASDSCHIDTVLGIIIQPLLQSCRLGAQSLQSAEMSIFMLNNVSVLQYEIVDISKRSRQSFKSSWLSLLETESSTWISILVNEEVMKTLKRSDLDKLLELIEVVPYELKGIDQLGLSNDRVSTVMRSFYASLFSTVSPQFERLQDPTLREIIRLSTAEKIAAAHAKVYSFVSAPRNGFNDGILLHTIDEVRVILGCGVLLQ